MSVLQIFVTPEELEQILQEFVARHGLRACRTNKQEYVLLDEGASLVQQDGGIQEMIFLFPPEAWNPDSPRPRYDGWIHVDPGQIHREGDKRILTVSTLQSEDRSNLLFKPSSWLRALKKRLNKIYTFSVVGENVVHGGSALHRDMGYSPLALELHRQGFIWKQFVKSNSEFSPA